jgi:hypothetical protein
MPDADMFLGLSLGFGALAIAFVYGPSVVGLFMGFFGALILMLFCISWIVTKSTGNRRGD